MAVALGQRDVKADVTAKNRYVVLAVREKDVKADVTANSR